MADMPRMGPSAIKVLETVRDSLGNGSPERLRNMLVGARMGPERVAPFYTSESSRYAYLGVNFTLDVTEVLKALIQTEAFCAIAPSVIAVRMGKYLRADIQHYTPIGPQRQYDDPMAKHSQRGAFGAVDRDEPTERTVAEMDIRRAEGLAKHSQGTIQKEAAKAAQIAAMAMSPGGRGLLPGKNQPLAQFGSMRRGERRFFDISKGEGTPEHIEGMMKHAISQALQAATAGTEGGGSMGGRWHIKWEGDPSGNLHDSIEVEAMGADGGTLIYASSLSYYAWFVEHGYGRVMAPILQVNWQDKQGYPHEAGVTKLPLRRLGAYKYLEAMLESREQKYEASGAPWYHQTGEPWLHFEQRSGSPQAPVRMFEKGFNKFMNRGPLKTPMGGAFFRGFEKAWKGGSAVAGIRTLRQNIKVAEAVVPVTTKTGRVVWVGRESRRFAKAPNAETQRSNRRPDNG